ncbi:MAG: FAD:protein FMN transferase [Rhodothermales bacterium]|nr:FAD:protein FMN transferase [Rhodothermales bacterium]
MTLFLLTILCFGLASEAQAQQIEDSRDLMGTRFRVVVEAGGDTTAARTAMDQAFARLSELEATFSDFHPESEVSRLASTGVLNASADLLTLLETSRFIHQTTGGAFDITVGNLTRLWRRAIRRGTLPTNVEVAEASRMSGWSHVERDGSVVRVTDGVRLDFGGIAKGYAADQALMALAAEGFPVALVDAGGDISAGKAPQGGWTVALPDGSAQFLENGSVATSGDVYRHVNVDGRRYSHILDPATGMGMTDRRTVTVVAASGTIADALASAFTVLPVDQIPAIVQSLGVSVYIERSEGPSLEFHPES